MQLIGELKDQKMALKIIEGLKQLGIFCEIHNLLEQEVYQIRLIESADIEGSADQLKKAQDFFRVSMGFQKPIEIDQEWLKIKKIPRGQYTYVLVMICIGLYLLSYSVLGDGLNNALFIGRVDSSLFFEVLHGQIWRLITPILVHLSFLHILFNMLWFKDLGYLIEFNFGKKFLLFFVLGTGLFSNIMQYLVSGPQFGGMSGVLYGMLGFIWVHKKLTLDFEYSLPRFDMGMMIGWFFICLTGFLGPIANTAHGSGLVAGIMAAVFYQFKWDKLRGKYFSLGIFFLIFTLAVEGYKLGGRYYMILWYQ